MVNMLWLLLIACASDNTHPVKRPPVRQSEPVPEADVVDERVHDLIDEHDGHVIAEVRARVLREGKEYRLEVSAAAEGPFVDPPPGFAGLQGSNAKTARELRAMYRSGAATFIIHDLSSAEQVTGHVRAGREGFVMRRRLGLHGRVVHEPATAEPQLMELLFETPSLPGGWHRADIIVEGHLRLWVTVAVDDHGATIQRIGQP